MNADRERAFGPLQNRVEYAFLRAREIGWFLVGTLITESLAGPHKTPVHEPALRVSLHEVMPLDEPLLFPELQFVENVAEPPQVVPDPPAIPQIPRPGILFL